MNSFPAASRGLKAALTAFAVLVASLTLGTAAATAASVTTGTAAFTLGVGKAGKALASSGVKVQKVAPATLNRKKKQYVAKLPVRTLEVGARSDVGLKGGFVFRKGKHAVKVTPLNVAVLKSGKIGVGGRIQKIAPKKSKVMTINLFNVAGKANVTSEGSVAEGTRTTLQIKGGKVSFTGAIIGVVRKHLGLKRNPRGQIATLGVSAVRTEDPVVDQYSEECGIPVASVLENSWPAASPLPVFGSAAAATGSGINWGLASSFRGYVYGTMSAPPENLGEKALQALDGATRFPTTPPGSFNPTRGFNFPVSSATYAPNTGDAADDQAIVNGSGTALFCNSKHGFWASIGNPTLVIDGANSRIVADISQNLYGPEGTDPWMPAQRVDLADLDLTGITPTYTPGTVTWTGIPVKLSSDAAPFATYPAGKELDPITVTLETE